MATTLNEIALSFSRIFESNPIHVRRLLWEEPEIEGCSIFQRRLDQPHHMLANIARVLFKIVAAPGMQWFPHAVTESFLNLQSQWKIEYADTPAAVLSTTTGKARAQYSPRGYKPSWVLKVVIKDGKLLSHKQVPFSEDIKAYTAISYPMESAEQLAEDDKFKPGPPPPDGRRYSLADRQIISGYLLMLYCSRLGDGAEYVWLDEFCLSDHGLSKEYDNSRIYLQRNEELGRLADIFRYAAQVVVFCHLFGCDHTSLSCPWGNRVWTIPEILHAQKVLQMTRETGSPIPTIGEVSGDIFREKMQYHAAEGNQWHLYAIFQNNVNSGAVSWQLAIHALVVEAIRRDEMGKYYDHKYLGKALNGLLPRRAHLNDLDRGGWNDLAWILELNQGFYNAATLAAICAISEDASVSWLGRPLKPMPGNERLEPIVTALPVAPPSDKASSGCPPLMIIGGEMIVLPTHLRRDWAGLYNNPAVRPIRIVAGGILVTAFVLLFILLVTSNFRAASAIFLIAPVGHAVIELLVSTMFLERKGWIFIRDSKWGREIEETQNKLGDMDSNLRTLKPWGESQLVPEWQSPTKRIGECIPGKFVDLKSGIYLETTLVELPDILVPLAIHGNGVTCISLRRGSRSHEKMFGAQKVGIANFPPHILAQTTKMGTVTIGSQWEEKNKTE